MIETALDIAFTQAEVSVWESLKPDLLSFEYQETEDNSADSISISLKDEKGKWAKKWSPNTGERVKVLINQKNDGKVVKKLNCGSFFVDSMKVAGSPRIFEMQGVSVPLNKPIRKLLRSEIWESTTLKDIATTIALFANVKLIYDVDSDVDTTYDKIEQKKESDLAFLSRLCEELGLGLKVTDSQLVIYDHKLYENKNPIKTLELGKSNILSWGFELSQSEIYKSVTVSWRMPKVKKKGRAGGKRRQKGATTTYEKAEKNPSVLEYTAYDKNADENGQEFSIRTRLSSEMQAKRKAEAKLRELNKRGVTGSLSLVGDVDLVAGVVIEVKGFGVFDGNFVIASATHSYSTSGYVTSINVRRVMKDF